MAGVSVRAATPADIPVILTLLMELAVYQKEPEEMVATPELVQRHYFDDGAPVRCFFAESVGKPVGMMTLCQSFSGFKSTPVLYIDCLIVTEQGRGTGAGRALIAKATEIAEAKGSCRINLEVFNWNESAQGFYQAMGFEDHGLLSYSLEPKNYARARGA